LRAPTDPLTPQYLKVYLTARERKKIRRQNRKEMQKERTEMIRIGLAKAPAPKVKISNLMRVLGSDAVQDPTKMEAHVRKQMADRLKKHQQANAERKLTDEQKAVKKTKKISEDTSLAVHVAVYRVKSLLHPSKKFKFKVEMNAKQLQMTGVILLHKNINLVVVEGGPKQQKFYKNLMLNRIKWEDEVIGQKKDADKDAPGERNHCQLIWEGQVKRRNFRDFTVVTATIEKQVWRETCWKSTTLPIIGMWPTAPRFFWKGRILHRSKYRCTQLTLCDSLSFNCLIVFIYIQINICFH
uniref:PRPF3 n=1 Tax=Haemonchus placei TaxID=6290 RepID=A0A0N4WVY1_HAEPC